MRRRFSLNSRKKHCVQKLAGLAVRVNEFDLYDPSRPGGGTVRGPARENGRGYLPFFLEPFFFEPFFFAFFLAISVLLELLTET